MQIHVAGENALIVYFADKVSEETTARIQYTVQVLKPHIGNTIIDLVPSYASLLVVFDPLKTDHLFIRQLIRLAYIEGENANIKSQKNIVRLPVYYGEEVSPDLNAIAQKNNLSPEQVIELHQVQTYQVYAIGFAPGFAYLGETDERIAMPRLSTPRKKVPKGAVAIADRQTAVYPAQSPGGWNLIGACPIPMFNPNAEPTMPLQAGDGVQFYAITKQEFLELDGDLTQWEALV